MRLDKAMVERQKAATRAKAQDAIKAGWVWVDDHIVTKNSYEVTDNMNIEVRSAEVSFVSRAGFKLYDVLGPFQISLKGRCVIDVGASTGGFSDVCLRSGVRCVYAVDVGHDQLDPSLLADPRLHNMERTNCRYLKRSQFDEPIDFACVDVSFISLKLILPALISCMETVEIVALVKPQFEAGKAFIGKHGIIKDHKVHARVLSDMYEYITSLGCFVHHIAPSSVVVRDGNQEFVFHISEQPCKRSFDMKRISKQESEMR